MCDTQFLDYIDNNSMQSYSGYPTPPSTNEDSPGSVHVSSPTYISDSSSSPVDFRPKQYVVLPGSVNPANIHTFTVSDSDDAPYLKMIEQPVDKFRFRYKSEMSGTHGSLCGENSDRTRKMTYPTVELCNHVGSAYIRCSIWQINEKRNDLTPHAHRLVKKKHGKEETDDPHNMLVNKDTNYKATFHSMGIIHTAKKNIVPELKKKITNLMLEDIARTGRTELNKKEEAEIKRLSEEESRSINLNVICLRFDAFYENDGIFFPLCQPIFSHVINNLKSALTGELKIVRMDHVTSPASGGREIFLLVERVTKKNIRVRFYEADDDDVVIWEDYGRFSDLDVHHQFAIVLKTPPYKNTDIIHEVKVFIELVRPTDNARSESRQFSYIPVSRSGAKRSRSNAFNSSDYDTSSIGSEFIPTTLNTIGSSLENINLLNISSDDLVVAMDMDSEDFKRIYDIHGADYESAGSNNLSVDFPGASSKSRNSCQQSTSGIKSYILGKEYQTKMSQVYRELTQLVKTKPDISRLSSFLKYHLKDKEEYNAFHVAVMIHEDKVIKFFVRLIQATGLYDLVNIVSDLGTVLHLATLCNNLTLIIALITSCKADISKRDRDLNTPLHLAAALDNSGDLLRELMKAKDAGEVVKEWNKSGDTALFQAISKKNLAAVRVLCEHGADLEHRHASNGFTPLRLAVENDDPEMVEFILYHPKVNPEVPDFKGNNPLQVAIHNRNISPRIKGLIEKYMTEHNIPKETVEVKEEMEDYDLSENEMVITEEEMKVEPLPDLILDLEKLYENVTSLSEDCLEKVSNELDSSGKWQELANLLDVEHLLSMQIFNENKSPSRQLINFVIDSNSASIKEIRELLEVLDETKAVEAMDIMAQTLHG